MSKLSLIDKKREQVHPATERQLWVTLEKLQRSHLSLHVCGVNLFGPSSHFSFYCNSSVGSDTLLRRKTPAWIYAGQSSIQATLVEVFHLRSQIFRALQDFGLSVRVFFNKMLRA